MKPSDELPVIVDQRAHIEFQRAVRSAGYDPANPWIDRYVDYQWQTLRHILQELALEPTQRQVLEFGCNVGAGAITAALLGMQVTALDIDANFVHIARINAERYGVADRVAFHHVPDTRALPFDREAFDLVICCSVLEYVDARLLAGVLREIDRVTAHHGIVLITATSNRLSPWEVHSGLWLLNYVPRAFDRWVGRELPRGVFPWTVRYGLGDAYENLDYLDCGRAFIRCREAFGISRLRLSVMRSLSVLCHLCGCSVGMLLPNMSMTLRKAASGTSSHAAHP